jgi:hypothetical protein
VYGSTFLWMTASFAGTSRPPGGAAWVIADVGALVSLALFTLAAWGVFRSRWWERAASAAAVAGLATLVPYWIAASSTPEPGLNKPIHIAGSAAVLIVLLVPALERRLKAWLSGEDRPGSSSPTVTGIATARSRPRHGSAVWGIPHHLLRGLPATARHQLLRR